MTTQHATVAPAIGYHNKLVFPQLVGGRRIISGLAKQLRAMPAMTPELDAHRIAIVQALESMDALDPTTMNTILEELYAWALTEIGGKRVCRISMFGMSK